MPSVIRADIVTEIRAAIFENNTLNDAYRDSWHEYQS